MMDRSVFERLVTRANLAPSVHNVQPARWRLRGDIIEVAADDAVALTAGDPSSADAGLSCGAAVEAMVLALGAEHLGAQVEDLWVEEDRQTWPGHRMAARLHFTGSDSTDPLESYLEKRFTWRGAFLPAPELKDWATDTAHLVNEQTMIDRIAVLNDEASHAIMNGAAFRQELLSWMRLSNGHPRHRYDGLSREALQMPVRDALFARWALGPFWRVLGLAGATRGLVAEAPLTRSAPVIACFHRPVGESPVATGRAYLRLCLEACARGAAGWPMAALTDHAQTRDDMQQLIGLPPDRALVQVIRFGRPSGPRPPRARRPIKELIAWT